MATAKSASAKKTTAKKTARKNAAPKTRQAAVKATADKAVNVYLGLLGKGLDVVQENIESARKDQEKRVSLLEKRGVKLRKAMTKRIKSIDVPEMDDIVKDTKRQISKAQSQLEKAQKQVEDAVEDAIGSAKAKPAAKQKAKRRTTTRKAA